MQLPQNIHPFSDPTLIVTADHVKASFWLAHEDQIEEVETLELPNQLDSDNEGSFVNTDNGAVNGPERTDTEHLHKLVHMIVDMVEQVSNEDSADHIHLVMEPKLLHAVKEHLSKDTLAKCKRDMPHNLMKESMIDIVKRLRTL